MRRDERDSRRPTVEGGLTDGMMECFALSLSPRSLADCFTRCFSRYLRKPGPLLNIGSVSPGAAITTGSYSLEKSGRLICSRGQRQRLFLADEQLNRREPHPSIGDELRDEPRHVRHVGGGRSGGLSGTPIHRISEQSRLVVLVVELGTPRLENLANAEVFDVDDVGDLDAVEADGRREPSAGVSARADALGELNGIQAGEVEGDLELAKTNGEVSQLVLKVEVETAVEIIATSSMLYSTREHFLGAGSSESARASSDDESDLLERLQGAGGIVAHPLAIRRGEEETIGRVEVSVGSTKGEDQTEATMLEPREAMVRLKLGQVTVAIVDAGRGEPV